MRTVVYVDGYNLYYGRITGTAYKWLDLPRLFEAILHAQDPSSVLTHLKYFTAPAVANFSRRGQESTDAQTTYHRALESANPDSFTKVLGKHSFSKTHLPKAYEGVKHPNKDDTVFVWKIVEKKTDVNLAMAMYRDAAKGDVDQLVICSNDSDAEPVLEAIREDFPKLRIGVVTPRRPPGESDRVVSTSLAQYADWTRGHITDDELSRAQLLSNVVSPRGKIFKKPPHWQTP